MLHSQQTKRSYAPAIFQFFDVMILNINVFYPGSDLLVLSSEDGTSVVLSQNAWTFDMVGGDLMQKHR